MHYNILQLSRIILYQTSSKLDVQYSYSKSSRISRLVAAEAAVLDAVGLGAVRITADSPPEPASVPPV